MLKSHHKAFIQHQHVFFVSTAPPEGFINLSPKGLDSFRVLDDETIVWLNLTGSGNETAAHLLEDNRMTIMFCAFEDKPLILRLYGNCVALHPRDEAFNQLLSLFPKMVGVRQIMKMKLTRVATSCGFGIPILEYKHERGELNDWANKKGEVGIYDYWMKKNVKSIDNKSTGLLK